MKLLVFGIVLSIICMILAWYHFVWPIVGKVALATLVLDLIAAIVVSRYR